MDEELLSLYIKNWDDVATTSLKTLSDLLDANLKIQRVRELHTPILYGFSTEYDCSHCKSECVDYSSDTDTVPYPCPTIKALDGEQ